MRSIGSIVFVACAVCVASAQSGRQLLGRLVQGDDQSQHPVAHVKVVLEESGGHDLSDDDGHFRLFLPDKLRPGDEVSITVTAPGFAVYEPPGGKLRIPADLGRTRK